MSTAMLIFAQSVVGTSYSMKPLNQIVQVWGALGTDTLHA